MAKNQSFEWSCDVPVCSASHSSSDESARYMKVPPGWAEISVTELNEDEPEAPECLCKCHEEEEDDEGDNVAGHETYDCENCPEDQDWTMSMILCELHYKKFAIDYRLPRADVSG
jgi:hypothetical protein